MLYLLVHITYNTILSLRKAKMTEDFYEIRWPFKQYIFPLITILI